MSNARRCRRTLHQRETSHASEVCDGCGGVVPDDQVAVLVAWLESGEPDWAFVGHALCAEAMAHHLETDHGVPLQIDDDGEWLRKAAGQ